MLRLANIAALSSAALAACSFGGSPATGIIDAAMPGLDSAAADSARDADNACNPATGEFFLDASSYRVIPFEVTFDQATQECDRTFERLAVIETQAEHLAVADHLVTNAIIGRDCQDNGNLACGWIGLRQVVGAATPAENWRWADGTPNNPMTAAFGWPVDEPNDDNDVEAGAEDCAQLRASALDWNDKACESLMPAVCECDPT